MLRARFTVAAGAALLILACGDDGMSPSSIVGTYDLVSVDGVTIPATINLGGVFDQTIDSGTLVLTEGGSATLTLVTDLGSSSVSGTYSVSGKTISVTMTSLLNELRGSGTVSGDEISITDQDGRVWVFRLR